MDNSLSGHDMPLTISVMTSNGIDPPPEKGHEAITGSTEGLRNGIWPQSVSLWMAAFYIPLFIIRPWEQLFPWMGEIYFERIYALCMIATVLLSRKTRFHITFQSFTIILFLIGIGLSGLFAVNPSLALDPFYEYLTLAIFYFILLSVVRTTYELMFIITCYILTMAIYLMKAQWEYFVNGQHVYDMGVVRLVGIESTFGGPNNLAMSIVVSLPMLFFLWSIRKKFSSEWPAFWRKWFSRMLVIYFLLSVSSIILTNSRSGMLGFILFVFLVSLSGKGILKKIGYILLGVLILSAIWQFMPEANQGRLITIWNPEAGPVNAQESAIGRIEGYHAGIEMFKRFPVTGVGVGNFIEYRVNNVDGEALNAHNLVGQILGETGFLGGGIFLLMVVVTLMNCRRVRVLAGTGYDPKVLDLSRLASACRNSIILLAFEGAFGHNLLRFNWLWLAAFSVLAAQYAMQSLQEIGADR